MADRPAQKQHPTAAQSHDVEMGDDGMVHCRTCGRSWWPHDPGRKLPDYTCAGEQAHGAGACAAWTRPIRGGRRMAATA